MSLKNPPDFEFPITPSEPALSLVRRMLTRDGRPNAVLRIGVKGGGCSGLEYVLRVDAEPKENDLQAEFEGMPFVCDPKSAKILMGSTLVATGNLIGGGLAIENPNADRSCGCGTSFTLKAKT